MKPPNSHLLWDVLVPQCCLPFCGLPILMKGMTDFSLAPPSLPLSLPLFLTLPELGQNNRWKDQILISWISCSLGSGSLCSRKKIPRSLFRGCTCRFLGGYLQPALSVCVCTHTGLLLQPFRKALFHHAPLVPSSLVGGVSYKVAADRFHSMGSTFGSWKPLAFA